MNKRLTILLVFISFFFGNVNAQYNGGFRNYKEERIKRFKFGLGWGFTETDQKPLYLFDGFKGWAGPGPIAILPKTFNVDYRFDPHFRLNLGLSYTRYYPRNVFRYNYTDLQSAGTIQINDSTEVVDDGSSTAKSGKYVYYGDKASYFCLDVNLLYNFRAFKHWWNLSPTWSLKNLHKEKMYFDGYFLAGLGMYNPIEIPTLNTGIGGDFWISYRWGLNFQTMAKWSMNSDNRFHMHHQFGVVFHVDQGNDAGALDALRRRNKKKKRPKAVIPEKRETSEGIEGNSDVEESTEEDEFEGFDE